jgi:hypothetical protein
MLTCGHKLQVEKINTEREAEINCKFHSNEVYKDFLVFLDDIVLVLWSEGEHAHLSDFGQYG